MRNELSQISLLWLYAAALVTGFLFAACFEVFRIRRRAFDRAGFGIAKKGLTMLLKGFIIGVEDILFFTAAGAVTSVLYFAFDSGRIRISTVFTEVLGFALYRITVGRLVMLVVDRIIDAVVRTLSYLMKKIVLPPVIYIKKRVCRLFRGTLAVFESSRLRADILRASRRGFLSKTDKGK